jgi:TRAP-type transport system periplasmic protein
MIKFLSAGIKKITAIYGLKKGDIMKIIKIISVFLPLVIYIFIISIQEVKPKPKVPAIELVFSTPFAANHTMQIRVFEPWTKKIYDLTKGKVEIKVYAVGNVGNANEQFDLARKGTADIAYALHDYTPGRFPMTEVFELPFMITKAETTAIVMWNTYQKYPDFQKEYKDVKVLALFCHPAGQFFTANRPISKISDFKGLKLRTVNPFVSSALVIFGATPVQQPVIETRKSIEEGKIDGTAIPWEGVFIFRLDDLLRFVTITNFYTETMMIVMNKNKFDSLPDDIKKVIDENSGLSLSTECGNVFDSTEEPYREQALKKGIIEFKLNQKDIKKLEALTLPLRMRWVKDMESKKLPGKEVFKSVSELLGKK